MRVAKYKVVGYYSMHCELLSMTLVSSLLLQCVHPQWLDQVKIALSRVDSSYLQQCQSESHWLPQTAQILNAFSVPKDSVRYILLGESPYPRQASANGFAFWDAAVDNLWNDTGLSTSVNRATSLRNLIKMLLHARGDLQTDFSQPAIAKLDKSQYVSSGEALFQSFINKGFLLLNASLIYSTKQVLFHAKQWQPFFHSLLKSLAETHPEAHLILLGQIANRIPPGLPFPCLKAEHPYNISFITNKDVLEFFKPLDILSKSHANHH